MSRWHSPPAAAVDGMDLLPSIPFPECEITYCTYPESPKIMTLSNVFLSLAYDMMLLLAFSPRSVLFFWTDSIARSQPPRE
eukprot:scaffold28665_cov61-Attheya_sp.AAC.1